MWSGWVDYDTGRHLCFWVVSCSWCFLTYSLDVMEVARPALVAVLVVKLRGCDGCDVEK